MDPRIEQLAENIVGYSVKLKKGENVLIDAKDVPESIAIALVRSAKRRGANPFVIYENAKIFREFIKTATEDQLKIWFSIELARMKQMDAYIALRGSNNIFEFSDVSVEKMNLFTKAIKSLQDYRVNNTRWVVLRWPNPSMAQLSQVSTEAFEDFYFKACNYNYARMLPGMKALMALMEKTDKVHITGLGTDLRFSIKKIPCQICCGLFNIPDGEVFTSPVKDSIEGHITYNAPTIYQGCSFDNVRFEFSKGKIISASSTNSKRLNQILNTDKGARYIGEFAIGVNPLIREPMRDILFDEKIYGSFHFTPGQAYKGAYNGNDSKIHWDLVCIQRSEYGGGEIRFDGKLIRKDGNFIPKSLKKLNADYLLKKN